MEKRKEIKRSNFVLAQRLAGPACLAALRSAAACVSGIVLEAGVQKQQGAEDKQAVRDSLNTATVASTVEGCEDLWSKRPINPPVPAGAGIWPPHAPPAISSNTPDLRCGPQLVSNSPNLRNSSDGPKWAHRFPQQL